MKYITLLFLVACSVSLYAMNDDDQELLPEIVKIDLGYQTRCVAFNPVGNKFLTVQAHGRTLRAYDNDNTQAIHSKEFESSIYDLFFSPSGDKVVTQFFGGVVTIENEEQTDYLNQFCPTPAVSRERFMASCFLKFNSHGDFVREIDDATVEVSYRTTEQGREAFSAQFRNNTEEIIISASIADNNYVAVASFSGVQVWDYKINKLIKERRYSKSNIRWAELNAAGDRMAIGYWLPECHSGSIIDIWDMQADEPLYSIRGVTAQVRFVDDKLITQCGHDLAIFDASTGEKIKDISEYWNDTYSFSVNNKYFTRSGLREIHLYDADGNVLAQIKHNGEVGSVVAVSPKGDSLAMTTEKGTSIWRLKHLLQKQAKL